MSILINEIERYFRETWDQGEFLWNSGKAIAVKMSHGVTVPVDYCLSTIARVQEQQFNSLPHLLKQITAVEAQLEKIGVGQFFYPLESLHISLLGCTPRLSSVDPFTSEKIAKIQTVCSRILEGVGKIEMDLCGVNITGAQVFIQVYPRDRRWAELRQKLEDALRNAGEEPLTYSDKLPIHMNIMRITHDDRQQLAQLLALIRKLRHHEIGTLQISTIEFLLTDFVVSSTNTQVYKKIYLG
jgi:hypothetical protein